MNYESHSPSPVSKRSRGSFISLTLLSLLFLTAGVLHFWRADVFASIVPPYLPAPFLLVYLSGVCEIAGGLGLWLPRFRTLAGWGLIALLIAVFPANIHMALCPEQFPAIPFWVLLARLPLQFLLIWWVYRTAIK